MRVSGTSPRLAVVGVGAVSARGVGWRELGRVVLEGAPLRSRRHALQSTHPGVEAAEVPPLQADQDAGDARQRRLMSRGARLAAVALREALREAGWNERGEEVGAFLGVGASGGAMEELGAMLVASAEEGCFALSRFGAAGLAACNPLFAFQLMNNFTLCHGSILEGVGGPNGTFFSRGEGTVRALEEALYALTRGECEQALAGGADSALHPVTYAELARAGLVKRGLVPGEGAAVLALAPVTRGAALAWVESCAVYSGFEALGEALARSRGAPVELVLTAAWGPLPRESLGRVARELGVRAVDAVEVLGESLAASPALAWATAVALLAERRARRILVLSAGPDGAVGEVELSAGGEA